MDRRSAGLAAFVGAGLAISACGQILGAGEVQLWSPDGGTGGGASESPDGFSPPLAADGGPGAPSSFDSSPATTVDAPDATTPDATTTPPDSGPDCGVLAVCGAACVDLTNSADNCGACGHSCGVADASCIAQTCQPVVLFEDKPIVGLAVDRGEVYIEVTFDGGGYPIYGVDQCPATGCAAPSSFLAPNDNTDPLLLAADGYVDILTQSGETELVQLISETTLTDIFSSGADQLDGVVAQGNAIMIGKEFINGGGVTVGHIVDGGVTYFALPSGNGDEAPGSSGPLATDGTNAIFAYQARDAGNTLRTTPVDGDGGIGNIVYSQVPQQVSIFDGGVYLINEGAVTTCPLTGCTGAAAPFVTLPLATIVATAIDSSGLYWLDSTGAINMCPLGGCPDGGVVSVVGSSPPVGQFVLCDGFVYFYASGGNATKVYKVAEPAP